jgi:nucleoside-diphosphate-sugar epimerase
MDVLVTGATGFVGYHLLRSLRARGCTVHVFAARGESTERLEREYSVIVHRGDVCDLDSLLEPMRKTQIVFHLAGIHGLWRPKEEYYRVNVGGTENVCQAALKVGIRRLIHVSTWAVYGIGRSRKPLNESSPVRPVPDTYTITKAAADQLVLRYINNHRLPATVIRPAVMFGPGDFVNFRRMAERLQAGKTVIIGEGTNHLTFVYVTDVVEGMVAAAFHDQGEGKIYNLGTDQPLTQEQFWATIAQEIRVSKPKIRVPYAALYSFAYMAEQTARLRPGSQPLVTRLGVKLFGTDNRIAIDKAHEDFGYRPKVPVRAGIALAARWYSEQQAPVFENSAAQSLEPVGSD